MTKTATPVEEARAAIRALSDADVARLMVVANYWWKKRRAMAVTPLPTPRDLMHQAIIDTLEGKRSWNPAVTMVKHLDGAMKSISGHEIERLRTRTSAHAGVRQHAAARPDTVDLPLPVHLVVPIDEVLDASKHWDEAVRMVGDGLHAQILTLKLHDWRAAEIREHLELDKTTYDSALKYIKRKLVAHAARQEDS